MTPVRRGEDREVVVAQRRPRADWVTDREHRAGAGGGENPGQGEKRADGPEPGAKFPSEQDGLPARRAVEGVNGGQERHGGLSAKEVLLYASGRRPPAREL